MYNEIMTFAEYQKEKSGTIADAEGFLNCFTSDKEALRINDLIESETERTLEIKVDALLSKLSSYVYKKTKINLIFIFCKPEGIIHFSCFKSESTAKEKLTERAFYYLFVKLNAELEEKSWSFIEYDFIRPYVESQYLSKSNEIDQEEEEMAVLMTELVSCLSSCFELNYKAHSSGLLIEKKVRKSA